MLELEGTTLGHYQLQQRLARGGMSDVYLAYDDEARDTVALKVVSKIQEDYAQRFQREVKAMEQLAHHHVLPVFQYGEDESYCYVAMPYIKDGTLRDRLNKGPLSLTEADKFFAQIAEAVQWAHDHGIIHRDIKPSNVLLQDGTHVYLADFGLARTMEDRGDITQTGCLIGTPEYMAPELAETIATPSSDIYALGVLLYQMLAGHVPFKASTPMAVYWKQMEEMPLPPSRLNPAISASVEQVILRALEKDPQRRFQTVSEMAQAFSAAVAMADSPERQRFLSTPSIRYYSANHVTLPPVLRGFIGTRKYRSRPAYIGIAAMLCLFILPLSLGLTLAFNGMHSALPGVLSASIQFANGNMPQKAVTPTPPTSGNTGTTTSGNKTSGTKTTPVNYHKSTTGRSGSGSHRGNGGDGHGGGGKGPGGGGGHGHGGGGGHGKGGDGHGGGGHGKGGH